MLFREHPTNTSRTYTFDSASPGFTEPVVQATQEAVEPPSMDLLDLGRPSEGFPSESPSQRWGLVPNPSMEQSLFQSKWESLPQGTHMDLPLSTLPSAEDLEAKAAALHIVCMASGDLGDLLKFYFFGKDNQDKLYFAEVVLNKPKSHFSAVIKTEAHNRADDFASTFMDCIAGYL